jgi:cytoskeletal protein CcmA (bactofilin family)
VLFKPSHSAKTEPENSQIEITSMPSLTINENLDSFNRDDLVVGEGVVLTGSLAVPNKAFVSGSINGDITVHSLIVGSTGKIEGKIDCQTADIAGHVKDDLHAHELLVVRASSTISGKIFYKEIDIEKGAKVTGQLFML